MMVPPSGAGQRGLGWGDDAPTVALAYDELDQFLDDHQATAIPMQIDHCEKLSSTVPKIRWRKPIVVTAMIPRSAMA